MMFNKSKINLKDFVLDYFWEENTKWLFFIIHFPSKGRGEIVLLTSSVLLPKREFHALVFGFEGSK